MKEASIRQLVSFGSSIILAWVFFLYGWKKVTNNPDTEVQFLEWGYDSQFAFQVGIAEIIGGLLLLIPKTTSIGAILLAGLMIGAIYTHLSTGIGSPVFPAVLLVCAVILCIMRWPESIIAGWLKRSK